MHYDMINWDEFQLTEPPVTVKPSTQELRLFAEKGTNGKDIILQFTGHTQAVERAIKLVIESCQTACGNTNDMA